MNKFLIAIFTLILIIFFLIIASNPFSNDYISNPSISDNTQKEIISESDITIISASIDEFQKVIIKPKQYVNTGLKDEEFLIENHEKINNKPYALVIPVESVDYFNEHNNAEHCLNYLSTIWNHGSIEKAINDLTNKTGHDFSHLETQFIDAESKCSKYNNKKENEIPTFMDEYLISSANLGNEYAKSKYASTLSQKAFFGKKIYTHEERLHFHREAIKILKELSDKGYRESILSLAMLLADNINFPEELDLEKAIHYINIYESLTGKDMTNFIDSIKRG